MCACPLTLVVGLKDYLNLFLLSSNHYSLLFLNLLRRPFSGVGWGGGWGGSWRLNPLSSTWSNMLQPCSWWSVETLGTSWSHSKWIIKEMIRSINVNQSALLNLSSIHSLTSTPRRWSWEPKMDVLQCSTWGIGLSDSNSLRNKQTLTHEKGHRPFQDDIEKGIPNIFAWNCQGHEFHTSDMQSMGSRIGELIESPVTVGEGSRRLASHGCND